MASFVTKVIMNFKASRLSNFVCSRLQRDWLAHY